MKQPTASPTTAPLSAPRPETTWSVMHPTLPDPAAMRRILEESKRYRVDSIEICGDCHGIYGGIEGVIDYRPYPEFGKVRDAGEVAARREAMGEIIGLCRDAGKPVYLWHREVMLPRELAETLPELFDGDGELDLLGPAYAQLLEYKISAAFEALPTLDGIVLTLTESDYSVIHNSTPDRYPPREVVARITRIFASELARRGKRFILRSFGSIAQDYEDILAGAAMVAPAFPFEIETKITPYDFDPFLPINPYLRPVPGAAIGAECDCVGEFLGAGHLPACNVARIVDYVRAARAAGTDRFAIRLDRVGRAIFDTSYEINLFAYHRAIDDPGATADAIYEEWGSLHWPARRREMRAVCEDGMRAVEHLNFLSGNVIFHTFPIDPSLKWIKAGGIFALFKEAVPLANLAGIWSILADRTSPGDREEILREKSEALAIAERSLATIETIRADLPPALLEALRREWGNARHAAHFYRAFFQAVCAYFDGIEQEDWEGKALDRELAASRPLFAEFLSGEEMEAPKRKTSGGDAYHDLWDVRAGSILELFARPLWAILHDLREEYAAESQARKDWSRREGVCDWILPGALTEEWRIRRYMHASHCRCSGGRLSRTVGNPVFPNGFVEFDLKTPSDGEAVVLIEADPASAGEMKVTLGDDAHVVALAAGTVRLPLPASGAERVRVRLEKSGRGYPEVYAVAVARSALECGSPLPPSLPLQEARQTPRR